MGFILVVAAVAFLAQLTVESLAGFAGGGRLGRREGLMAWWHFDRDLRAVENVSTCIVV